MSNLLNQSAAKKLAKSLGIHLGETGINELNIRIEQILIDSAAKARKAKRKTILERDIKHEKDLFS